MGLLWAFSWCCGFGLSSAVSFRLGLDHILYVWSISGPYKTQPVLGKARCFGSLEAGFSLWAVLVFKDGVLILGSAWNGLGTEGREENGNGNGNANRAL